MRARYADTSSTADTSPDLMASACAVASRQMSSVIASAPAGSGAAGHAERAGRPPVAVDQQLGDLLAAGDAFVDAAMRLSDQGEVDPVGACAPSHGGVLTRDRLLAASRPEPLDRRHCLVRRLRRA